MSTRSTIGPQVRMKKNAVIRKRKVPITRKLTQCVLIVAMIRPSMPSP